MKKSKLIAQLVMMFILITGLHQLHAQTPAYKQTFDNFFNDKLGIYGNQVTVVVGCPQGILYEYNNGYNSESVLPVQSLSKWVTASIIMMLEEENKLELDDKVSMYIPSWNTPEKQNITIRQTLDHTGRIVDGTSWDESSGDSLRQAVDNISAYTTLIPPSTYNFNYGSTSYKVAARVAEIVEGKQWKTIFAERLGNVCGMGATVYSPSAINNPATGRGLITTRTDYSNFLRMILRFGMHNNTRIMDSASIRTIAAHSAYVNSITTYGLGVYRESIINGVSQESMHFGVNGAFAWVDHSRGYFGLIMTTAGQGPTGPTSQTFRQMVRDHVPANSCTSAPQPTCDFAVTAGNTNANPAPGAALNLNFNCSGTNCSGATFAWSGNGISGNQNPKSITAPTTPGTYTYQIAANKSGCPQKTATTSITVGATGSGCVVNKVRLHFRNAGDCCMSRLVGAKIQGSNNGGTSWTDLHTFTSNGTGSFQDFPISNTTAYSSARFVASSTGWGELRELEFYNGTTKLSGTTFGTDNYANAFDGNTATEWHAPTTPGPNNYAGMNFTGCTSTPACDFNVTASASPSTVAVSGTTSLSFSCTGANCGSTGFAWSGQGISGNQNPKSITAPATAGTYIYTITATKSGCADKTATTSVTATSGPTTYNQCQESELMNGNGAITSDPNASNNLTRGEKTNYNHYVDYVLTGVPSAGTYYVTLRYYSGSALPIIGVQANSGTTQTYTLPNSGSWNIVWANYQFSVNLNAGNNTIRISGTGGGSCRQDRICVSNTSGSPAVLGIDPAESNTLKALSVLPNPNKGTFQTDFYLEKGKKATIIISDLQGRIIYRQSVIGQGQHREKINLNNKASGTLLLQLQKEGGAEVKKINIAR